MNKPEFVISAPFDTYSGYGARSRDLIKSIIDLDKYDVKLLPQMWGNTAWGFCDDHEDWKYLNDLRIEGIKQGEKPNIWMQVTIPSEFQPVGEYNIGATAGIESTQCDPSWIEGLNRMNMNWVSSKHAKQVFQTAKFEQRNKENNILIKTIGLQKPIHVVFEGADVNTYKHLPTVDLDLSMVKESFNYLFVGHWMNGDMGHDRKNVGLMIKEFFETWKGKKQRPGLILKTTMGKDSYMSEDIILKKIKKIKDSIGGDLPSVYVMTGELSNSQLNELYNHPKVKAMICYTKGEGFGRPLMEFGFSKKPIICSGWSGHLDFLNPSFTYLLPGELENVHKSAANNWLKEEAQWFKPSLSHGRKAMKEVFTKYKKWAVKGKQQSHYLKTYFTLDKMGELVDNILNHNLPEFQPKAQQVELNMPPNINSGVVNLPTIK
jgi:hypothetical protein|tara:strand:+ start:9382 stop:10680 length:1299 start_codon:yes stop_codon:yes gene_type:complete